jgi:hypothetical protein
MRFITPLHIPGRAPAIDHIDLRDSPRHILVEEAERGCGLMFGPANAERKIERRYIARVFP